MNKEKTQILFIPSGKTKLDIPSSIEHLGQTLLQSSTELTEISLENNVKWSTEKGILYSPDFQTIIAICGGVQEAVINSNVVNVEDYAAYNVKKLTSITFSGSKLTVIGENSFASSGLSSFDLSSALASFASSGLIYANSEKY